MGSSNYTTLVPSIISSDHTGFIKNQYSFFNVRSLIYSPSPPNITKVLISLDAEKTFDRVELDYLFYTLGRFGFGPNFIWWIRTHYSSPMAAVHTNNNRSTLFRLQGDTRQGFPLFFAFICHHN